jgi:hypothetical protein
MLSGCWRVLTKDHNRPRWMSLPGSSRSDARCSFRQPDLPSRRHVIEAERRLLTRTTPRENWTPTQIDPASSKECRIKYVTRFRTPGIRRSMRRWRGVLVGTSSEQEVDDVAFVRLQPVELQCPYFTDVESVDVCCIEQLT